MINNNVDPFSNTIWNYEKKLHPNNLIDVSKKDLIMSLLPRTTGKFSRIGLCVNRMRYKSKDVNYTEKYLSGDTVTVSYNPDDVSIVWVLDKGQYIPFYIIEKRYLNKTASEVSDIQKVYQEIINRVKPQNIQSKINLMSYIDTVVNTSQTHINEVDVKKIKETKKREKSKTHIDLALENEVYK
jgi:Mu transposase, C-terminal.